ncbi:hypothetical protein ES703_86947 [subsurface metagenome]
MVWYHKHEIIVQEFIRAGAALVGWMWGLWYLGKIGVLVISPQVALIVSVSLSTVMFSVLVVLRKRTGQKLQVTRIRYMLILILMVCVAVFIRFMSQGEVIRAVLSAIVVLFLGALTLFIMRKRGGNW